MGGFFCITSANTPALPQVLQQFGHYRFCATLNVVVVGFDYYVFLALL